MKTFAIHSPNDAAILIKLHDDLVKAGFASDSWNKRFFDNGLIPARAVVYKDNSVDLYQDRIVMKADELFFITPSNYDAILSEIIESRS